MQSWISCSHFRASSLLLQPSDIFVAELSACTLTSELPRGRSALSVEMLLSLKTNCARPSCNRPWPTWRPWLGWRHLICVRDGTREARDAGGISRRPACGGDARDEPGWPRGRQPAHQLLLLHLPREIALEQVRSGWLDVVRLLAHAARLHAGELDVKLGHGRAELLAMLDVE